MLTGSCHSSVLRKRLQQHFTPFLYPILLLSSNRKKCIIKPPMFFFLYYGLVPTSVFLICRLRAWVNFHWLEYNSFFYGLHNFILPLMVYGIFWRNKKGHKLFFCLLSIYFINLLGTNISSDLSNFTSSLYFKVYGSCLRFRGSWGSVLDGSSNIVEITTFLWALPGLRFNFSPWYLKNNWENYTKIYLRSWLAVWISLPQLSLNHRSSPLSPIPVKVARWTTLSAASDSPKQ